MRGCQQPVGEEGKWHLFVYLQARQAEICAHIVIVRLSNNGAFPLYSTKQQLFTKLWIPASVIINQRYQSSASGFQVNVRGRREDGRLLIERVR